MEAVKLEAVSRARRTPQPAVLAFLALLPAAFWIPITHDAIWQIWIGRQLLHGAGLYTDIVEINPPLWFWIAIPLSWIGETFGIAARHLIVGFFAASIALALYLTPRTYRLPLLIASSILALKDFGQREHLTLISTAPYVFLIASRLEGKSSRHPWLIGFFAAVGFALKPHFVVVPIVLEFLLWSKPRIRPETVALALSAIVYAFSTVFFAQTYLTEVIPMAYKAYGEFYGGYALQFPLIALLITAFGLWLGQRKGFPVSRSLFIASLAFLPAAIIQAKGWSYHTIPTRGFLFLAITAELMYYRRRPIADACLVGAALMCFFPVGIYRNIYRPDVEPLLANVAPGTSVLVVSPNPSAAWPMVEERGFIWSSRQFCLWQAGAALADPGQIPEVREIVRLDLARRPDILLIDRRPIVKPVIDGVIQQDELGDYVFKGRSRLFDAYARRTND